MDPLEKEQLRNKMALRMGSFAEGATTVMCVSGHYYLEPQFCELCQSTHTNDIMVIKNRVGKKLKTSSTCLREMVRFRVTDVEDFPKWLGKLSELRAEAERRDEAEKLKREEERKKLEKKVIVRKRTPERNGLADSKD